MITSYPLADRKLHQLCQVIAKASRTFVPALEDDSHTNLSFDGLGDRIVGRWIATPNGKRILGLHLSTLSYQWWDEAGKTLANIAAVGKTQTEIESEIKAQLPVFGLRPDGFEAPLHFDIPTYDFAALPVESLTVNELNAWRAFRTLANTSCASLLEYLQIVAETRIWPHHFDTGWYAQAHDQIGIGFGLAMEEHASEGAYFYMAGYPKTGEISYTNLPEIGEGRWKTGEGFRGAILPLNKIEQKSLSEIQVEINVFMINSITWFLSSV